MWVCVMTSSHINPVSEKRYLIRTENVNIQKQNSQNQTWWFLGEIFSKI